MSRATVNGLGSSEDAPTAAPVDVTVVIPTRNRIGFLSEAVESIRRQSLTAWQVVVVDDASDDGSAEQAQSLLGDDPRMRLVALEQHAERSKARNLGLAAASGRFVLFLDDDDRLLPRALEQLVAALDRQPDATLAIGARRAFDGRGQVRRAPHPRFRVRTSLVSELLLGWLTAWVAVPGQCLVRTELIRAVGGWNETLVGPEDQELLLRLTLRRPALLVPQAVLEYRLHDTQWRPPDVREQEDEFRREIARKVQDSGIDGPSLLRAGELLREADQRYDGFEYRAAFRLLLRSAAVSPRVLTSPVIAPPFLHLCAKSAVGALLGSTGAGVARAGRGRIRRRLSRAPVAHVAVLSQAPTLPGRAGGYRAVGRETVD
jgi:glycosyltransferase involved in cell wall biosynthesis